MDRFNSLLVFFLLTFFVVSVSANNASPTDHDVLLVSTDDRNSTTTASSKEEHLDLLKHAEHHFTNFVKKYEKTYADEEEHAYRLSVFKSNLRRAKRHQKLDPTAVHGITQFSDLTLMEFRRNLLGGFGVKRVKLLEDNVGLEATILPTNNLPADFDWRDRGVVTPVKNQEHCGSDYAFSALGAIEGAYALATGKHVDLSALGAIEGAYALATGKHVDLSEQEVIDCSFQIYHDGKLNYGCDGGSIYTVFQHVRNKGFVSELQYPYTSGRSQRHGSCRINIRTSNPSVANFSVVNSHNEDQIAANLVKNGPLAVVTRINIKYMSTYIGGVSCPLICPYELFNGHGVVLVGYGAGAYSPIRLKKEPYWIFKNSWGTSWGEQGYYRICKGRDDACKGLMNEVITVTTTSS